MSNPFLDIANKFIEFSDKKDSIMMAHLKDREAEILDLNREQLKDRGENADGVKIKSYQPYSPVTQRYNSRKTTSADVDLYDEGDFHSAFFVTFGKDWFSIYSNDDKVEKLERKYGEIFGLTDDSREHLVSLFKEDFIEDFRKIIIG